MILHNHKHVVQLNDHHSFVLYRYLLKPRKVLLKDETQNKDSVTTALTNEAATNVKTVS